MYLRYPPFETTNQSGTSSGISVDFITPYFYFKIISIINKDFSTRNNINEDLKVSGFFVYYVIYLDKGKIIEHGKLIILDNPETLELKTFMSRVR